MPSTTSTPAGKRRAAARSGQRRPLRKKAAPKQRTARASSARSPAPAKTRRSKPRSRPSPRRAAATPKRSRRRRWFRLGRPSLRVLAIVVPLLAGALAAGYVFWLRDSSLVAVNEVEVNGISGPQAREVTAALTDAGREMTTLNVREDVLRAAVKGFPTVVSVSADPELLHGLVVEVVERPAALVARSGGQSVPVAPDGTLLRGLQLGDAGAGLPVLDLPELPRSTRLQGEALAQGVVLGATPKPLRPTVEGVDVSADDGVEVTLRGGIPVRFGTHLRAKEKWVAAAAILADPELTTFTYIDVQAPERAAVGGAGSPTSPTSGEVAAEPTL